MEHLLLQDGQLTKIRLSPLTMLSLELFENADLQVDVGRVVADLLSLALIFEIDIGQGG
jgi:hypothetical protein